jgi:hypothetical protein
MLLGDEDARVCETTVEATGKRPRNIARHSNIEDPEQVKTFIASKECTNGFKESLAEAYDLYVKFRELNWNKPFCEKYDKQPKIPSDQRIETLIANANKRFALILSMMKDIVVC